MKMHNSSPATFYLSNVALSAHALQRMAQRAIPECLVRLLVSCGKRAYDKHGAVRVHLHDQRCQRRFAEQLKAFDAKVDPNRYRDIYAVLDPRGEARDGVVITVGRLSKARKAAYVPTLRTRFRAMQCLTAASKFSF